ncbi:MAG: CotS family spore coat protein [Firmicutes bacterium]|nr:CotS family spore coat protein [Bacillota bacterium]
MLFSVDTQGKWQDAKAAQELLQEVEDRYDLDVRRFAQDGPIYVLDTSLGRKALKESGLSQFELEYITHSLADLDKQGFKSVVVPLTTDDGSRFFRWEDSHYLLMDWVKGRHCDYLNVSDALAVAKALGRLHGASQGIRFDPVPDTRWLLGFWPLHFSRRLDQLKAFARHARRRSVPRSFDRLYLRDFDRYYRQAVRGLEKLSDSDYAELCRNLSLRAFCHRDLAYHNILMDDVGPKFLDFDYSLVDLGLHDLADLLLRNLVLVGWKWERAYLILDAYSSVIPLDYRAYPVLEAFLQFPHEYWQIGLQYYEEKQPWPEEHFLARYNRKLESPNLRLRFLNTFAQAFA